MDWPPYTHPAAHPITQQLGGRWIPAVGQLVIWTDPGWPTNHWLVTAGSTWTSHRTWVYHPDGRMALRALSELRPATQEELAKHRLASLEGL